MNTNLNVAMAPKDSTFQVRMNSEIKRAVEDIYAKTGMTLTDAFNTFIQQSLNVEGLPFIVTTAFLLFLPYAASFFLPNPVLK